MTYPVDNSVDNEGNKTEKAVAWEKAFIRLAKVGNFDTNTNDTSMLFYFIGFVTYLFDSIVHVPSFMLLLFM